MLRDFWAYVLGYLVLVVKGDHPERFINLALARGVLLWDLVRVDERTLLVKIRVGAFPFIRPIARRTRCRAKIKSRHGLPFFLYRLSKRKMLVGGAVAFALIIYLLAAMVWTVDVVGTSRVSATQVKLVAATAGLRAGVLRYGLDGNRVADRLIQEIPGIAYAEVEVRTRSLIRITEKAIPETDRGPCNLVATKEGMVKSILVLAGVPLVQEGDMVRPGQVLVSGVIRPKVEEQEKNNGQEKKVQPRPEPRLVQARGVVQARVWYRSYGEAPREESIDRETGRVTRIVYVKINDKKIVLRGPQRIPYTLYHYRVTRRKFPQWRNITFPVEFVTIETREIKRTTLHHSRPEAVAMAAAAARRSLKHRLPAGLPVKEEVRQLEAGDRNLVRVLLTCEAVEDVTRARPIEEDQIASP